MPQPQFLKETWAIGKWEHTVDTAIEYDYDIHTSDTVMIIV